MNNINATAHLKTVRVTEAVPAVSAFALIREGTEDAFGKILKAQTTFYQMPISAAFCVMQKINYFDIIKYRPKLKNSLPFKEEKINLELQKERFNATQQTLSTWALSNFRTRTLVLDANTFDESVKKLQAYEVLCNSRRFKDDQNFKIVSYNDGVCYIMPSEERSEDFKKFAEILEIKEY